MRHKLINVLVFICFATSFAFAQTQPTAPAQQPSAVVAEPEAPRVTVQAEGQASVLRLMKCSGTLRDPPGNPRTGVVGLTFALYKDQQGGSPLWLEAHNAQLDEQGRYTVLLGSTKNEGLPLELFSSGEARWLGVQANLPGEEEQPRVLLVSVPYALKAADAETLGGKPPSAFLPAESQATDSTVKSGKAESERSKEAVAERPDRVYSHMAGYIPKYTSPGVFNDTTAPILENGTNIGIGTTVPNQKLDVLGNLWAGGSSATLPDPNTWNNFIIAGGTALNSSAGEIHVAANYPGPNANVGLFAFSNYSIAAADKRIGLILGATDDAANSGNMQFYTANAGILGERVRIDKSGLKVTGTGNGITFPDGTTQTSACGTLFSRPLLTSLRSFLQSGIPQSSSQEAFQGLPQFAQAASCGDFSEVFIQLITKLEEQRRDLARLKSEMEGLKSQLNQLLDQRTK